MFCDNFVFDKKLEFAPLSITPLLIFWKVNINFDNLSTTNLVILKVINRLINIINRFCEKKRVILLQGMRYFLAMECASGVDKLDKQLFL